MSEIYKSAAGAEILAQRYAEQLRHWPVANDQMQVPTRHGETFVVASGAVDAPPLILLHGSGGNAANWWAEVPVWAAQFRTYAVDLIGEPGRSASTRLPLDTDGMSQWLGDVFDGLGLTSAAVVGMSLGGWVATDLATRNPERVSALALLCPGGIGRQTKGWMVTAIPLMMLGNWGKRKSVAQVTGLDDPQILDDVVINFAHFKPRTETLPVFTDDALQRLTMPVQVIVGDKDVMFDSAETARRIRHSVPGAQVTVLAGTGHAVVGQANSVLHLLLQ